VGTPELKIGDGSNNGIDENDFQRVNNKYVNNSKMLQQIDEVDSNVMSVNYMESPEKADELSSPEKSNNF
jgi:hypothetical protein